MSHNSNIEYPVSAGGVVCRNRNGSIEVVLCGRNDAGTWNLPKGTPDPGESIEQTALREAAEETGLQVELQGYIGNINYWFVKPEKKVKCHKTVHFYLMTPTSGSTATHDLEFDVVSWFSAEDALRLLTHENEARIVQEAISIVAKESSQ